MFCWSSFFLPILACFLTIYCILFHFLSKFLWVLILKVLLLGLHFRLLSFMLLFSFFLASASIVFLSGIAGAAPSWHPLHFMHSWGPGIPCHVRCGRKTWQWEWADESNAILLIYSPKEKHCIQDLNEDMSHFIFEAGGHIHLPWPPWSQYIPGLPYIPTLAHGLRWQIQWRWQWQWEWQWQWQWQLYIITTMTRETAI